MFALRVEFLTGRCVAKETHVTAEWPPHPARLFSALVSSLYAPVDCSKAADQEERDALGWLQKQGAPEIAFSAEQRRTVVTTYVPVNDVALPTSTAQQLVRELGTALAGKTRKKANTKKDPVEAARKKLRDGIVAALTLMPERQSARKPRTFPTVAPDDAVVHYIWPAADIGQHRPAFERLLSRLSYLGHSSSVVSIGIVESGWPEERWVPNGRGEKFRGFSNSQLEALEAVFPINERAEQSYRLPFVPVAYGPPSREPEEPKLAFGRDWIVFQKTGGVDLPISATLDVTQALRRLIVEQPGHQRQLSDRARALLSGKAADGTLLREDHVAWLALPFVGRGHARGLGT